MSSSNSSSSSEKFYRKIPSFAWILIIVGGIALFIGAIIGGLYALAFVEGFASVILLLCGWTAFRIGNNSPGFKSSSIGIAIVVSFFALMGMSLDQAGNYFYNKPIEWIFCPPESELARRVTKRAARGGVSLSQDFICTPESGSPDFVSKISDFELFAFRFFEYVLIGYLLLGASLLYTRIKLSFKKTGRKKGAAVV